MINPARFDPSKAMPYIFMSTKPRVLCCKPAATGSIPQRFICVDVVVVIDCHVVNCTHLYRDPSKLVKQIIASPLRGEHERAGAFFGTIFGQGALGYNTYGIVTGDTKVDGISYRTFIKNTAATDSPRNGVLQPVTPRTHSSLNGGSCLQFVHSKAWVSPLDTSGGMHSHRTVDRILCLRARS